MPDDLDNQIDVKEEPMTLDNMSAEATSNTSFAEATSNTSFAVTSQKAQQLGFQDNNCLMLKDTTLDILPSNLKELFKHFQPGTMTIADVCYQLCYLVALETGFAELNVYRACVDELYNSCIVTSYYDAQNVRNLTQFKPTIERSDTGLHFSMQIRSLADENCIEPLGLDEAELSTLLSAIVTGDFMIVSLTPMLKKRTRGFNCSRSICLSMPRYIVSVMTQQNKKTLNDCLRNMDEFTRRLRDELFVPVRSHHLQLLEVDIYPALEGLPLETYNVILKHLGSSHLKTLAKVNKQFFELISIRNNKFESTSSSIRSQDLPHIMSSYFEMEPYYQLA